MTSHRRGLLGALALALSAGVVVALVLVAGSPSPTTAAGAAKAPAGAATVRQRNLVQTDTEAGTLSYANAQTVYDRLSGTITWLPRVGQVIRAGGTLFRVNGSPVLLMNGDTPAYRALSSADTDGPDVLELNRNLVALGFNANGIVVDDVWQPATSLGVELLQESLGETATGSLSLGKVVFLPGPQLVGTVEGTVGNTANGGSAATLASVTADPPAPEFVSLTTDVATTTTTTTTTTTPTTTTPTTPTTPSPTHHHKRRKGAGQAPSLAALLALLKAESAQLKAEAEQLKAEQHQNGQGNSPSGNGTGANNNSGNHNSGNQGSGNNNSGNNNSGNHNSGNNDGGNGNAGASSGAGGSTGEAVLETTSTHLVVTVDLDASVQSEAKVGEPVSVQLPGGNTVNGKVTAVSSVAQSSSSGANGSGNGGGSGGGGGGGSGGGGGNGSGSSSTIPVTVTLSGHHKGAGLDEAAVSVNFAQARAKNVLSVPVTALVAVSGGNYAVQEAAAPHSLLPVSVGLFAAGYVQISGPGIHTGLQVTDSQG
jgi:hypothetical protein